MKELVEKLAALCAEFAKDANAQVENGNKAAGRIVVTAATCRCSCISQINSNICIGGTA